MLDVACGHGRHMAWFARHGLHTTGIDRSAQALADAGRFGQVILADLEAPHGPLLEQDLPHPFDVIVVSNYLWRPLFAWIVQNLAPGGLLLYETFAQGNERFGRPARPDFLLQPGELLQRCQGLQILAYEHGLLNHPARCMQRIAAVAPMGLATSKDCALFEPHWLE